MIKLKDLYEGTIADEDARAASNMKNKLVSVLSSIEQSMKDVDKELSGFGAPGLKAAFGDAIKKSFKGNKFDTRSALKHLDKYYKR